MVTDTAFHLYSDGGQEREEQRFVDAFGHSVWLACRSRLGCIGIRELAVYPLNPISGEPAARSHVAFRLKYPLLAQSASCVPHEILRLGPSRPE